MDVLTAYSLFSTFKSQTACVASGLGGGMAEANASDCLAGNMKDAVRIFQKEEFDICAKTDEAEVFTARSKQCFRQSFACAEWAQSEQPS